MIAPEETRSVIVQKFLNNKKIFLVNFISSGLIIIFLIIISFQIKKAGVIIQENIKGNTITIHDTVFVKAPRNFICWQCKNELKGINQGTVKCCGFEYTVKSGELFGKKIEE